MADETQMQPDGLSTEDPEAARAEIAMTRARMSETIDEIEDALLRRKERIQTKLDPFSSVRERPWPAVGVVFGAGLVLGLLTGGEEDEDDGYDLDALYEGVGAAAGGAAASAAAKGRKLKGRARDAAEAAVEKVEDLGEALEDRFAEWQDEWDDEDWSGEASAALKGLQESVADWVSPLVRGLRRRLFGGTRWR